MTNRLSILLPALLCCVAASTQAQQARLLLSPVLVGYATGDSLNCPFGVGVGADAEGRLGGTINIGASIGFRLAEAPVCKSQLGMREVDGQMLEEHSHLSLTTVPLATLSVGAEGTLWGIRVLPRLRAGAIRGTIDALEAVQKWMPLGQFEIAAGRGASMLLVRFGLIRSLVLLQTGESRPRETVHHEHATRRIFEVGLQIPCSGLPCNGAR